MSGYSSDQAADMAPGSNTSHIQRRRAGTRELFAKGTSGRAVEKRVNPLHSIQEYMHKLDIRVWWGSLHSTGDVALLYWLAWMLMAVVEKPWVQAHVATTIWVRMGHRTSESKNYHGRCRCA